MTGYWGILAAALLGAAEGDDPPRSDQPPVSVGVYTPSIFFGNAIVMRIPIQLAVLQVRIACGGANALAVERESLHAHRQRGTAGGTGRAADTCHLIFRHYRAERVQLL